MVSLFVLICNTITFWPKKFGFPLCLCPRCGVESGAALYRGFSPMVALLVLIVLFRFLVALRLLLLLLLLPIRLFRVVCCLFLIFPVLVFLFLISHSFIVSSKDLFFAVFGLSASFDCRAISVALVFVGSF